VTALKKWLVYKNISCAATAQNFNEFWTNEEGLVLINTVLTNSINKV